jgi:hypothetical protein
MGGQAVTDRLSDEQVVDAVAAWGDYESNLSAEGVIGALAREVQEWRLMRERQTLLLARPRHGGPR